MNRAQMIMAIEPLIDLIKNKKENGNPVFFVPTLPELSDEEKANDEYEALGYYVSNHPLDKYYDTLGQLQNTLDIKDEVEGSTVTIGGIVTGFKEIVTKNGKPMAFFILEDLFGRIEVVVYSNMYLRFKDLLTKNNVVELVGKLEIQLREVNGEEISTPKLILYSIKPLEQKRKITKIVLYPRATDNFKKIADIIKTNPGTIPIEIEYSEAIIKCDYKITSNKNILEELESTCLLEKQYGETE